MCVYVCVYKYMHVCVCLKMLEATSDIFFMLSNLFCETEFLAGTWVSLVWLN